MNSTERAFSDIIHSLVPEGSKVIVAFSGGCDSLALLCLCRETLGKDRVIPVYVNHNLRPEPELAAEIRLNRVNCRELGLDLKERTLEKGEVKALAAQRGGGAEDAARTLRYKILEEERIRSGASLILTAHHMQDQIETILMRISSGAPATSLRGISRLDGNRHLTRPLLDFSRDELEAYLKDRGLKWSTDSTNSDACFRRNLIRNEALPEIQAIWPDLEKSILGLGKQACDVWKEDLTVRSDSIPADAFNGRTAEQRMVMIFSMWDHVFGEKDLPMSLVDRVLRALASGTDCAEGSNGAVFTIHHGTLYLTDPSDDADAEAFELPFTPGKDIESELPFGLVFRSGSPAEPYGNTKSLRMDSSAFGECTVIRFARTGDRIMLKDGTKTVARLLQDMGIPAVLRKRVPVLADEAGICAVLGSAFGGRDRICVKFITSLAPNGIPLYIVSKG